MHAGGGDGVWQGSKGVLAAILKNLWKNQKNLEPTHGSSMVVPW